MRMLALSCLAIILAPAVGAAPPEGFTSLLNGVDFTGWWGLGTKDPRKWSAATDAALAKRKRTSLKNIRAHWSYDGQELVNDGRGLFLTTDRDYGDFELRLEYKTGPKTDSGIYLRGIPQVQIWDSTKAGGKWRVGADKGSGGLWNNSLGAPGKDPLVLADRPFGEWNTFRIVMVGERVTVFYNGHLVVDHARLENFFDRALPVPRVGPIQLQTHGGEIRWRNVWLREIAAEEANTILRNGGPDKATPTRGFVPIFNGTDFTGWKGPTHNYEVKDGALMCKQGAGGTIYTEASYDDFAVRLEIKLPPGGNNGLAIRYPGKGDTAYVGMCELQVLDNTHQKFATLDARQFHASVYGQIAAHRGYLREPNTWNYQEVTVRGSRITVELNGTLILDADIAKTADLMYDIKRFAGRLRTSGHFGFAGHNDPVAFRNVEIKRLPAATTP